MYSAVAAEHVTVHLSDGTSFPCPAEVLSASGLSAGSDVDPARLAELQREAELVFARQSALRLLGRASQTRRALARKLAARGFGTDAVRAALFRMEELGYLDDRAFARDWARARIGASAVGAGAVGWKAVYRGLLARGVPRRLAEEAASEACTPEVELEAARRVAAGLAPRRAASRLSARGFRAAAIAVTIRELRGQGGSEE